LFLGGKRVSYRKTGCAIVIKVSLFFKPFSIAQRPLVESQPAQEDMQHGQLIDNRLTVSMAAASLAGRGNAA